MNTKTVSVVILSRSGSGYIIPCLESLWRSTYGALDVIVLVSGPDSSYWAQNLRSKFPKTRLLCIDFFPGFPTGGNVGASFAKGTYIFFLNDDTTISPDTISDLVRVMARNDRIGIAGALIYDPNSRRLSENFLKIGSPASLTFFLRGRISVHTPSTSSGDWVDLIHGAAFMIRTELFQELDGFDDSLFMFSEESDLCMRARKMGFLITYAPRSMVFHRGSGTVGRVIPDRLHEYLSTRNGFITFLKVTPLTVRILTMTMLIGMTFLRLGVHNSLTSMGLRIPIERREHIDLQYRALKGASLFLLSKSAKKSAKQFRQRCLSQTRILDDI